MSDETIIPTGSASRSAPSSIDAQPGPFTFDAAKTALIVIDMQRDFIEPGGFAYLPAGKPHAFLNLTDEPGELIMVFAPGGGHKFFEELAPVARAATHDRAAIAAVFENHDMTLLGPPLTAD